MTIYKMVTMFSVYCGVFIASVYFLIWFYCLCRDYARGMTLHFQDMNTFVPKPWACNPRPSLGNVTGVCLLICIVGSLILGLTWPVSFPAAVLYIILTHIRKRNRPMQQVQEILSDDV
jgi:hypothetical protein